MKNEFLGGIIDKKIEFSQQINWNSPNENLFLANDESQILGAMKLRYLVYEHEGYLTWNQSKNSIVFLSKEIPEPFNIPGLLFDEYEQNSVTLNYLKKNQIVGSIRMSFNVGTGLPFQETYDFSRITEKYNTVELTRQVIHPEHRGGKLIWPAFYQGIYRLSQDNDIQVVMATIKESHYKLYKKFGGMNLEANLGNIYGLDENHLMLSWHIEKISRFFRRAILRIGAANQHC